ncbi:Lrp/AsnC family transcriptional regulator [Streptomyces cheonanensis]|uniref:Lrp/AsnC family transcriptional regulator n=2 Tax=Streptomyces TaxID=1883 RepID=A0ABP5H604_9ACTN
MPHKLDNPYSLARTGPYGVYRLSSGENPGMAIDELDGRLLELLARRPRIGVLEASRRLGVARGTAQARLDKLRRTGVIRGFGPEVDPAAIGYPVTAFATLEIKQGRGAEVRAHLASVPEVLELHTITGQGDMLCRLVARSNADLQRVIDRVVGFDGIVRSATAIVMENPVPYRTTALVRHAAHLSPSSGPSGAPHGSPPG